MSIALKNLNMKSDFHMFEQLKCKNVPPTSSTPTSHAAAPVGAEVGLVTEVELVRHEERPAPPIRQSLIGRTHTLFRTKKKQKRERGIYMYTRTHVCKQVSK